MREELLDMEQLSDSREVMAQKSPMGIRVFLLIVAAMLSAALTWAYFGKLDTYVEAMGEIRTDSAAATVTLPSGGKIKEIRCYDGDVVQKGDILYVLDDSYYQEQMDAFTAQMEDKRRDIADYETLKAAIRQDKNLFSEAENPVFYYQYEDYRIELQSTMQQIDDANEQVSGDASVYRQSASQAKEQASGYAKQKAVYEALYQSIRDGKDFTSDDAVANGIYQSYQTSLAKAQASYDQCEAAYQDLAQMAMDSENPGTENETSGIATATDAIPDAALDAKLRQAKYARDVALSDLNAVKNSALSSVASSIAELTQQIASSEASADSYTTRNNALHYNGSESISREKIKNAYYISISKSVKNLEAEIAALENQSLELKEALRKVEVTAQQSGTLVQHQLYAAGDTVGAGTTMASIIPAGGSYEVMLYIPEGRIAEVHIGQTVEYTFSAISETEFGKAHGAITAVAADSLMDETSGQKYYRATATIDDMILHGKDGEDRTLQVGMVAQAHAITGHQRVIVWLLDKLNFR